MGVTRLKRKGLRNKANAKKRQDNIKSLRHLPPVKNVDVEKIKEEFAKKSGKQPKSKPAEEDTTAVAKEPAKAQQPASKPAEEDTTAVAKEPAKAQVEDTDAEEKAPSE